MDNYTSIEDFTLAISHITQDEDGCYTWDFFNSLLDSSAAPYEGLDPVSRVASGKFRTSPEGRGVWRWSEYLCDWVQIVEDCYFSLACEPSIQQRRLAALHTEPEW